MKSKNKLKYVIGMICLLFVFLTGCGNGEEGASADIENDGKSDDKIVIGVTSMTLKESVYHFMRDAATEKAKELGAEVVWQSSENDPTTQYNQVENFIAQGIDILVIEPARSDASDRHVKLAQDAGIPVINLEALIPGVQMDLRISADSYKVGVAQVEDFAKEWGDHPANVVVLSGTKGDEVAESITQGVMETLKNYPQYKVIVQQSHANWDRQLALNTVENALTKFNKDIQVIFANNDAMVHGAIKAAENTGVKDDILFYGGDADKDTIELLLKGMTNLKTVDKGAQLQGERIAEAAVKIAKGEGAPQDEIIKSDEYDIPVWWTPLEMISTDNLDPMKVKYPDLVK